MKLAFTICANNYLAQANVLACSYKKEHPDSQFILAMLDFPNENVNYNELGADKIIWIHELFPSLIENYKNKYEIAELCTVVKPEMFMYFFSKGLKTVIYIDPDIKVYSKFEEVFNNLLNFDVILTPHICSPTGEVGHPLDKDLMRTGIYNLGFLAINNTKKTFSFIEWWDKRVKSFGYHDLQKGFFYDQIWLGYAPAFLEKVYILRNLGYNVANWNLHERLLGTLNGKLIVNDLIELKFFHFSHFKIENLPEIAPYNKNFNLNNRPDLKFIFDDYINDLKMNNYEKYKMIPYKFGKQNEIGKDNFSSGIKDLRIFKSLYLLKRSIRMLIKGY